MRPEEALEAARAAAARARAEGAYGEALDGFEIAPTDRVSTEQLVEWAVIEPDVSAVRSTRPRGALITWAKRALLRVLRQYHAQAHAQQTRFNLHAAVRITELEERLEQLERARRERP
ncbi:MAG TPA: hypothetical protein VF529_16860 [Solirubrobacteraceae bacterium]|jgi:hypothetical protein